MKISNKVKMNEENIIRIKFITNANISLWIKNYVNVFIDLIYSLSPVSKDKTLWLYSNRRIATNANKLIDRPKKK